MKKLSVIVPETVVNYEAVSDAISITFANVFGGFNQYEGNGGWVDDSGKLVKEKHIRVEGFGDMAAIDDASLLEIMEAFVLVDENQDCILLEYDGQGAIVSGRIEIFRYLKDLKHMKR